MDPRCRSLLGKKCKEFGPFPFLQLANAKQPSISLLFLASIFANITCKCRFGSLGKSTWAEDWSPGRGVQSWRISRRLWCRQTMGGLVCIWLWHLVALGYGHA